MEKAKTGEVEKFLYFCLAASFEDPDVTNHSRCVDGVLARLLWCFPWRFNQGVSFQSEWTDKRPIASSFNSSMLGSCFPSSGRKLCTVMTCNVTSNRRRAVFKLEKSFADFECTVWKI